MATINNNMGWEVFIPLIAQYGLPLAEALWKKWASGNPPTEEDWIELRAMASQTALDRMKVALVNAGFSLSDPKAIALMQLTTSTNVSQPQPPAA